MARPVYSTYWSVNVMVLLVLLIVWLHFSVFSRRRSSYTAVRACHPSETSPLRNGKTGQFHHIYLLPSTLTGHIINTILFLQYLSCLTTSRSLTDKLAFDVGLQEDSIGNGQPGKSLWAHNRTQKCYYLNINSILLLKCWERSMENL